MNDDWLILVTSLPSDNATLRQRVWRALKAGGAAALRDGVYLLPARPACQATLDAQQADIQAAAGTALVLRTSEPEGAGFAALFEREAEWVALAADVEAAHAALPAEAAGTARHARKLRKALAALAAIDFFPGAAQARAQAALEALEQAAARAQSPHEPQALAADLAPLERTHHQGRVWATRARPWVDRLASAWLIRRFIDPAARILWLASPADCPPAALGFDFDGAAFSHVGPRVTFEVLALRFGLADAALTRLGRIVRHLDMGGSAPPEAAGVESVLAGLRAACAHDDDALLVRASAVFDGLYTHFSTPAPHPS